MPFTQTLPFEFFRSIRYVIESLRDSILTRSCFLSQVKFLLPKKFQAINLVSFQFFQPPMATIMLSANSTAAGSECAKSNPSASGLKEFDVSEVWRHPASKTNSP